MISQYLLVSLMTYFRTMLTEIVVLAIHTDNSLPRRLVKLIRGRGRRFPASTPSVVHFAAPDLGAFSVYYGICSFDFAAHPNVRTVENAMILGVF